MRSLLSNYVSDEETDNSIENSAGIAHFLSFKFEFKALTK